MAYEKLAGICIGGPHEGEIHNCSKPVICLPEICDDRGYYRSHHYRFEQIHSADRHPNLGFWVHDSIPQDTDWVAYMSDRFSQMALALKAGRGLA